jgi:hypothetical protein
MLALPPIRNSHDGFYSLVFRFKAEVTPSPLAILLDRKHTIAFPTSRLIVPPNGAGGGGRYLPSIVVVALGEPGVPVVCWAKVEPAVRARTEAENTNARIVGVEFMVRLLEMTVPSSEPVSLNISSLGRDCDLDQLRKLTLNPCERLCDFGRKRIIAL